MVQSIMLYALLTIQFFDMTQMYTLKLKQEALDWTVACQVKKIQAAVRFYLPLKGTVKTLKHEVNTN